MMMKQRMSLEVFYRVALYLVSGFILLFLIMPSLIVIIISFNPSSYLDFPPDGLSFRWYKEFFTSRAWTSAFWVSVKVAAATSVLATLLGLPTSFALVRYQFPGKTFLYGLIVSPLVLPLIVIAISVYFWFAKLNMIGTYYGLILAHTMVGLPIFVVVVTSVLKNFDQNLEKAAMSLGARPLRTFWEITMPIIRPSVISGSLFAFIMSFDELIITIFICGNTVTIPKRMWDSVRYEIEPTLAAVSTIIIAISFAILIGVEAMRRRLKAKKGF